ncbi:hypothetical protein LguiB_006685 [Lonicera macranthoides]
MSDDQSQPLNSDNSLLDQRPESSEAPLKIPRFDEEDDWGDEDEEEPKESIISDGVMNRNPRIQRYLVAIEYIGTRFSGAQQQSNCRTVVGVLEDAFHKFIGQPVSIFCSSRTDAGVHALSNVCHVDVERISKRKPDEVLPPHEPTVVIRAVNHFLQKNEGDITVIDVRSVAADFHARYKAQERTYFYRLLSGPECVSTFEKGRAWHIPEELDLSAMQKACKVLVGRHDFSSFRASGCQVVNLLLLISRFSLSIVIVKSHFLLIRDLEELNVAEVDSTPPFPSVVGWGPQNIEASQGFGIPRRHRCFVVTARARSFLYHQVRLLVGVLKSVGTGDITVPDVERILKARTVTAASAMAPACGLYLARVKYDLP